MPLSTLSKDFAVQRKGCALAFHSQHQAVVRLAAIVRREALDDRLLLAYARSEEPEFAPARERLCVRQR